MKNFSIKNRPLTEEQIARLKALDDLPDEAIDYSDIPPLTEEDFARAVRPVQVRGDDGPYVPLCMDLDVAEWFRTRAEGDPAWQRRINLLLRAYMEREDSKSAA